MGSGRGSIEVAERDVPMRRRDTLSVTVWPWRNGGLFQASLGQSRLGAVDLTSI